MITDINDYIGLVSIPSPSSDEALDSLEKELEGYENIALKNLLGYPLYKDYLANQTDPRVIDIIQGKEFEFTFEGSTVNEKYEGLESSTSLLIYWNFYNWLSRNISTSSNVGELASLSENGMVINPNSKLVQAWNLYIEKAGEIPNTYIGRYGATRLGFTIDKNSLSTYPHYNDNGSLYNFLLSNKETYSEWVYGINEKTNKNVYNL